MKMSPLIAVSGILVVVIVGLIMYAPSPETASSVTVQVTGPTYEQLVAWGKSHPGADGRPLSAGQVIEVLIRR